MNATAFRKIVVSNGLRQIINGYDDELSEVIDILQNLLCYFLNSKFLELYYFLHFSNYYL
jgi:hypothetical protein